jgi:UDP-2-acetamido-3-amino-2,3-dideoxy-glucuronate N-acetyltransferase
MLVVKGSWQAIIPEVSMHPTTEVSQGAFIGSGTRIWRRSHGREHAVIGEHCNIVEGGVDAHVKISSNVKIQNHASIFEGVKLEDGAPAGPHVCFTNNLFPRAITPDGKFKSAANWALW